MATRAQKTKVGLFLVGSGAIITLMLGLMVGLHREERVPYVVEFEESVLGLNVDGLVEYKGVPVGTVKDIVVAGSNKARIDVQIDSKKVELHEGVEAQLVLYSLAMGTMCISLSGGDLNGELLAPGSTIPSTKSRIESISGQVEHILEGINGIAAKISAGLEGMKEGELTGVIRNADGLITQTRESVARIAADVEPGAQKLRELVENWQGLSSDTRTLVQHIDGLVIQLKGQTKALNVTETQADFRKALRNLDELITVLRHTATVVDTTTQALLRESGNVEYNLRDTLKTLNQTLEAVRDLAEYLQEDPAALLRGKGEPKGGR